MTIAAGQTIAGVNLAMVPVGASRVSGTVVDSQGRPLANSSAFLTQRGPNRLQINNSVGLGGAFVFGAVPPGDYTLRADVPGTAAETAPMEISVGGSDISDLQLVVMKPSIVRGRVAFDRGGTPPPEPSTIALTVSTDSRSRNVPVRDDGTFEFTMQAGPVRIRASARDDLWRLRRVVMSDGADVIDSGLIAPPNAAVDGVIVEMTARQPEVSGTVIDAAGASVRDCLVVVFAQDSGRWTQPSRFIGATRPGPDDTFVLRLPPGDYFAAAFHDVDPALAVNDPDILRQLREHAASFSIDEGAKQTLRVPLVATPVYDAGADCSHRDAVGSGAGHLGATATAAAAAAAAADGGHPRTRRRRRYRSAAAPRGDPDRPGRRVERRAAHEPREPQREHRWRWDLRVHESPARPLLPHRIQGTVRADGVGPGFRDRRRQAAGSASPPNASIMSTSRCRAAA